MQLDIKYSATWLWLWECSGAKSGLACHYSTDNWSGMGWLIFMLIGDSWHKVHYQCLHLWNFGGSPNWQVDLHGSIQKIFTSQPQFRIDHIVWSYHRQMVFASSQWSYQNIGTKYSCEPKHPHQIQDQTFSSIVSTFYQVRSISQIIERLKTHY